MELFGRRRCTPSNEGKSFLMKSHITMKSQTTTTRANTPCCPQQASHVQRVRRRVRFRGDVTRVATLDEVPRAGVPAPDRLEGREQTTPLRRGKASSPQSVSRSS